MYNFAGGRGELYLRSSLFLLPQFALSPWNSREIHCHPYILCTLDETLIMGFILKSCLVVGTCTEEKIMMLELGDYP